ARLVVLGIPGSDDLAAHLGAQRIDCRTAHALSPFIGAVRRADNRNSPIMSLRGLARQRPDQSVTTARIGVRRTSLARERTPNDATERRRHRPHRDRHFVARLPLMGGASQARSDCPIRERVRALWAMFAICRVSD